MTSDPPPGRRPGLGRLWTDPRETEEHTPWLEPKQAPQPPLPRPQNGYDPGEPPGDEAAVYRRNRAIGILLGVLIAALLVGAGVLGASLLGGDDSPSQPAALPVAPGAAPADQRSRSIRAIYASAKDSIVPVRVRGVSSAGSGTGFVIDRGGVIVTNAHVVSDASQVQVRVDDRGSYVDARVVGKDLSSDLAVLRVPEAAKLRPLPLADSDKVRVGDQTLAIGYPLGINRSASASAGIVSGLGRSIDAQNQFSIDKVIQTDAAINPGNSGGPLLDSLGRVIGVNTAILTAGGGGSVGVGFAVPSNTMREVVPRLEAGRTIKRAYLGVRTSESLSGPGALVASLTPGAPASAGGVRVGDVIVGVDGDQITTPEDVSLAIDDREPGDSVELVVRRGGATRTLSVVLGTRPDQAPSTGTPSIP